MTQIPYLDLVIPPVSEPVSLAEAKAALALKDLMKMWDVTEDQYLMSLIRAARQQAEEYLRRSIITQCWQLQFDQYAPSIIALQKGPIQAIKCVKIITQDWSENVLDKNNYYLRGEKLYFNALPMGMVVQIQYLAGYGDRADVPQSIKDGIFDHIVHMYEQRGSSTELPETTIRSYARHKMVKI